MARRTRTSNMCRARALLCHASRCVCEAKPKPAPPPRRVDCSGGSPFQVFLNQRLRVAKQAALPTDKTSTGSLTAAALKRARDACVAEWQLLTQEQKRPYKDLFEARLAERRRIATERLESGPGEGNAGPLCPSSHWGCGSGTAVVHPKFVREALAATGRLPPPAEVYNTTEFTITSPEESPMLGAGLQLEPCHLLGRPVCKTHPKHKHLSQIHDAMKVMTDRLGKDVVATGDVLCLFEGAHPDGAHEVFALLTRASYSPKFQDWTLCKPLATEVGRGALEFPVLVELDSRLLPALPGGLATAATTLRTEPATTSPSASARWLLNGGFECAATSFSARLACELWASTPERHSTSVVVRQEAATAGTNRAVVAAAATSSIGAPCHCQLKCARPWPWTHWATRLQPGTAHTSGRARLWSGPLCKMAEAGPRRCRCRLLRLPHLWPTLRQDSRR